MMKKAVNYLSALLILLVIIICLALVFKRVLIVHPQSAEEIDSVVVENAGDPTVYAIVVVKAMSGHSYMDDRDYIATMPELKTMTEMENFIAKYKPSSGDQTLVRESLENAGLNILSQDSIFINVSGLLSSFQNIFPSIKAPIKTLDEGQKLVFSGENLQTNGPHMSLIDGLILLPQYDQVHASQSPINVNTNNDNSDTYQTYTSYSYEALVEALNIDKVHAQGLTGKGVNIGFIDDSVMGGHQFFVDHPVDLRYYRFVDGQVTLVGNNFNPAPVDNPYHGTQVASFLAVTAPDAILRSFASPTYDWELNDPINFISGYLSYMDEWDLVDVLSISLGFNEEEEEEGLDPFLAEIRTGLINLISNGTIVLVASGNIDSLTESGHNAIAAIPEVIAIGGSELTQFGESGFLFSASARAASFESILYNGRAVPDFVSVIGNFRVPTVDNSFGTGWGTSFATPQIAGLVALLKQQNPELSQSQVKMLLANNALDITTGTNSDGISAGPGYDLPTGFGQPIADWAIQETKVLQNGLNLIGITKDYSYTGRSLLNEMNLQGGDCYYISHWETSTQSYQGLIVDDGEVYGTDFQIEPNKGYWVKCRRQSFWTQNGTEYIDQGIPINFVQGWNVISIPYSNAPCTTGELNFETNDLCWRILEYDGKFDEFQNRLKDYGYNFTLLPGKGYMVLCDDDVTWTPTCTSNRAGSFEVLPQNTTVNLQSQPKFTLEEITSLYKEESILEDRVVSNALKFTGNDREIINRDPNPAFRSERADNCSPLDVFVSNVSDKTFTISWRTAQPCIGSMYTTQDNITYTQSFDDRGYQFSGLTHHITTQGLTAESEYYLLIASGDTLYGFYSVSTGRTLDQASNRYTALGEISDAEQDKLSDAIVYVNLWDGHETSSLLSFPVGTFSDNYAVAMGDAKNQGYSSYYDHSSTIGMDLFIEGGYLFDYQYIGVDLDNTPQVVIDETVLGNIPDTPELFAPATTIASKQPSFTFISPDSNSQEIQYRLEISKNNFSSIAYEFDQRTSTVGWSQTSFSPGETATFTIPVMLDNNSAYQWRVFAYDPNTGVWSGSSEIQPFTILVYDSYIPMIIR